IFKSLGEYVEAKEHYEKALAIAEKIGDRETEAKCNGNLGSISHSLGEYVNAQEYYEKALAIAGKIGHRERESYFYTMLGWCIFLCLGEYVKAKECFDKVLELSRKRGKIESCTYLALSLCMLKLGNIHEGNSNIFASINKSEVIRRLQVQEKYKISHFDHVVKREYRLASDFLSNSGFLYEAFYIEEYGRARTLADLMAARYSEENEISVTPQ
ncbi:unnamed protein product, partial [Porites evermanni]